MLFRLLSIFFCLASSLSAYAEEKIILIPSKSKIEFHAIGHPSFLKVNGVASLLKGHFIPDKKTVRGTASIALGYLDTGIELRNKHMKEKYLEIKKYPEAQFTLTECQLPKPLSESTLSFSKLPFRGELFLHGVKKIISGEANIEKKNNEISIKSEFKMKISDFKIPEPGYKGITLADEVTVLIDASGEIKK